MKRRIAFWPGPAARICQSETILSAPFRNCAGALIALGLLLSSPVAAQDKVAVLGTGSQPGHYWVWNGRPLLPIGDSVTQGWMESGTNFNQTDYIDALAARGINIAMIWSYIGTDGTNQTSDARIGYNAPEIWPWQGSIESNTMDLGQFHQAYFDRLRSFVSYAESKDIVVLITLHDGWTKDRFNRHPFNSTQGNGPLTANTQYVELADYSNEMPTTFNSSWTRQQKNQYYQERFADKLISELEPYSNVVFEMFNEGEWYNQTNRCLHEEHFLKFFHDRTSTLLMTNTDHISGDNPNQNSNAGVVSLHPNPWTGNYNEYASTFANTPAKPVFVSEPVPQFDGVNLTPATIRRSAWEAALAGTGWLAQNDTSFGWDPNAAIVSQAAARTDTYDQIGRVARFMNDHGIPFWNMAPNASLSNAAMVLAHPGHDYVVYAPTGGSVTLNLSAGAGQSLNVSWYDPETGVTASAGTTTATGTKSFTAPDANDWVLRVGESAFPATSTVVTWEFNASGNRQGWSANSGDLSVTGGKWNVLPSSTDPRLTGPAINFAGNQASIVEIGFSSTDSNISGQLFWKVQGDSGFSEARSQTFTLLGGGQHTYLFDLSGDPDWTGQITQLRLDPVSSGNGGTVAIDFIRLLTLATLGDYNDDASIDAGDYLLWRKNVGAAAGTLSNDINGGAIGSAQYDTWRANFAPNASSTPIQRAVPEPAAALLAGLLMLCGGAMIRSVRQYRLHALHLRRQSLDRLAIATLSFALSGSAAVYAQPSSDIGVSASGHYITYKGETRLLVGDSGTQVVTQNANVDYRQWIDDNAKRGVNAIHAWSFLAPRQKQDGSVKESRFGYVYPGLTPWARKTTGANATDQLKQWDLQSFDEGPDGDPDHYWSRLRDMVGYAKSKDMVVGITAFFGWPKHNSAGQPDWSYHPFNTVNGGPVSDSANPITQAQLIDTPGTEIYTQTWSDSWSERKKTQWVWEKFADKLIQETSEFGNVFFVYMDEHSYSEGNMGDHFRDFFMDRGAKWVDWEARRSTVDFVMSGTTSASNEFSNAATGFNNSPARPYVYLEGPPYLGTTARNKMWTFAVGGGHFFYHNDAEQETVTTGMQGYDPNVVGGDKGMLRRDWLGHVSRFFNKHVNNLDTMAPNGSLSSTGIAMADPGDEYVAYALTGGSFTVNLSAGSGQLLNVRWYDPQTGVMGTSGTVVASGTKSFTAPSASDWVLHIGPSGFPTTSPITTWEFNTNGNRQGWVANATAGDQNVSSGMWNLLPSGADPILTGPTINIPADLANVVEIGIRSLDTNISGQLFWKVQGDAGFTEARSQPFTLLASGTSHTYLFDLSADPDWTGQITQLRLDPVSTGGGATVSIDFVRLLTASTPGDYTGDGSVDTADYLVWRKTNIYGDLGYELWRANFGTTGGNGSAGASAAAVPEASTIAMLAGLALLCGIRRGWRFRSTGTSN